MKYSGEWTKVQVSHLLRRTTYGSSFEDIKKAAALTLDELLDVLLAEKVLPAEPVNYYYEDDPSVPIGASWVDKPFARNDNMIIASRRRSIAAWTLGNLLNGGIHIIEKLTLFWSNHFVTQASVLNDPNFIYYNNNLLRSRALGNFRNLVKSVTINPAMLRYLNGNQNTVVRPMKIMHENYWNYSQLEKGH